MTPTGIDVSSPTAEPPRPTVLVALVLGLRPKQWLKNALIGVAPLAAGALGDPDVLRAVLIAIVTWCAASSAVYLVNDVLDADADRAHPTKRRRPVASGALPVPLALAAAVTATVVAVTVTVVVLGWASAALLGAYLVIQLVYCVWTKHEPVFDLLSVASGFVLRGAAGGVAAGVVLSPWFLLVTTFGALFVVAGKRYGELVHVLRAGAASRPSVTRYSESFLRFVWTMSASLTLLTYALWAFEGQDDGAGFWIEMSVAALTACLLRYALVVDAGEAGEPEEVLLADRGLLVLGAVLVGMVVAGVAGG